MTTDNETVGEAISIIVRIGDFKCERVIPRLALQQMQGQGFDIGQMVQQQINRLDRMIAASKEAK